VKGQRDKDLMAWARDPTNISRNGVALSPERITKRRKAEKRRKRWLRRRAAKNARRMERSIKSRVRAGELVLWGDAWPDLPTVMRPEPVDPDERPPWE
jgi:hypothetical protein